MVSTGLWAQCYRYLHLILLCVLSLLFSLSLLSLCRFNIWLVFFFPPKDKHNLIPSSLVHLHIFRRTASASCILSVLFWTACPNSSWQGLGEPREHLCMCTHAHRQIHWNRPCHCLTICIHRHRAAKYTSFIEYVQYVKVSITFGALKRLFQTSSQSSQRKWEEREDCGFSQ